MPILKDTEASLDIGCEKYAAPEMFTGEHASIKHILDNGMACLRPAELEIECGLGHVVSKPVVSPVHLDKEKYNDQFGLGEYLVETEENLVPSLTKEDQGRRSCGECSEEVGEKGLLESRSPTFRIDSSEKDMRRTGFEGPEETETSKCALDIWKYVLFNLTIMPLKRSAIGRSTKQAKRRREERASETSEQRKTRQERDRVNTALARSLETNEQRQARQQRNRNHSTQTRQTMHTDLNLCGFNYNPLYNYSFHPSVIIGKMDKKCTYCGAQKFKNETPGMCCAGGKVKLPDLRSPPEPLLTLVSGRDKTPIGQYGRQFNAPTIHEVAIVIVGEEFNSRDIILHRRNGDVQRVSETHRSYDALQYPTLFFQGEDGYHFNIKMKNPTTNVDINIKVSAMNYHAYRMMIRENADNHILKCRQLFHPYIVDMYAKIESERLLYIRLNQVKFRSEEYIHLRDAVVNDGNLSELGKMVILPSTFTGSPRHMHEYTQDAMTYVRAYGRPDFFITFTCNPAWDEVKELLLTGQSPLDRHDISALVFKQKLKSLIDFTVKHHVFGETRYWMYSIEWQKRGLPHAHILRWMMKKITPNRIDEIISAEIPDIETDKDLHDIVSKNMIHGPCGSLNNNSPCMSDGKCTKRYPRDLLAETITGNDGYPLYRRRSTEDGGNSIKLKVLNNTIDVDNRWVVPYSPLLLKTYNAHINVDYCNSVKAIKYICKYVNKGSDMAVFGVENTTASNDEVTQYQLGRYISSNEAVWRILSFSIHGRYPTVVHLAVHLENGQRVYFTSENLRA
ncbi:helitron_like_N domain-containing protein [Trichonephila clavipes]|nr:helitron_like_N domain-containing protein [Trichonephila clavipes]